jgi:hypothetical protein
MARARMIAATAVVMSAIAAVITAIARP